MNRRLHAASTAATAALSVAAALCCALTAAPGTAAAPAAASRDDAGRPAQQRQALGTAARTASCATAFLPPAG